MTFLTKSLRTRDASKLIPLDALRRENDEVLMTSITSQPKKGIH